MNVKEFISSGIIESYLLGTATEQEIAMVNDMKANHPEVLDEIIRIENALIGVAESGQPELNSQIKANILGAIKPKENSKSENNNVIKMVPVANSKVLSYKYGIAASIGLLIISSILNVLWFNRSNKMNDELAKLNRKMQSQDSSLKNMNSQLAIFMDPSSKSVVMKGLAISPESVAKVCWNERSSEVYLMVSQLPAPPTDMQYQLWAIVDGKPVDAGMVDLNSPNQMHQMKNISAPQAFAVTLEKKGGSPSPTMDAMYLIGNV